MPVRQMARRLGISEKSVRNTWERAKRKLRQRLVLDEIR
jgi:DNA-binding CsgD family transcriptional regulator